MRFRKYFLFFIFFIGFMSMHQVAVSQANQGSRSSDAGSITDVLEMTSLDGAGYTPSFGMEIHNFDLLPKAKAVNNHWVRHNALLWSDYQPDNANQFIRDTDLEEDMVAVSQAGMELILIVRSAPTWAREYEWSACAPMAQEHIADFADFMHELVAFYSQPPYNVTYYEVWNEPDGVLLEESAETWPYGCWGDESDDCFGGGYYAEMLKGVYPAIKSANPNAQVVLGGLLLACDPRQPGESGYCPAEDDEWWGWQLDQARFFEGVLRGNENVPEGGGKYFDYVNYHGFTYYEEDMSVIQMEQNVAYWSANGGQVAGKLDYLRYIMFEYGIMKPVILSEVTILDHLETENIAGFQAAKADYVVWLYTRNLAKDIKATTWYHLDGPGWYQGGLLDANQEPTPSYEAFKVLTTALDGAIYQRDLNLETGMVGFEFTRDTKRVWVLFSEDNNQHTINLPDYFIRAYNLFGEAISPAQGQISYKRPIYIEAHLQDPAQIFTDVDSSYWAFDAINNLYSMGITNGCNIDPLQFCPEADVTRAEMAKFLLTAINGQGFTPEVDVSQGTSFSDVKGDHWAAGWIEQLYQDQLTDGCSQDPLEFCPDALVSRAEMAKFLLMAMNADNPDYEPTQAVQYVFNDVKPNYWAIAWIEQLYNEGVTQGCDINPLKFCPSESVTRAEMAVFLIRGFASE